MSRPYLVGSVLLVLTQGLLAAFFPPSYFLTWFSNVTQLALLLTCSVLLIRAAKKTRGPSRLFFGLLLCGFALWTVVQILWTYYEVILRRPTPNPFVGDIILFVHIVPMMGALAIQPHREETPILAKSGWLDFLLLHVWWLFLYAYVVLPWQYVAFDENLYGQSFNTLYVTEKIVLLGGIALARARARNGWKILYGHWFWCMVLYTIGAYAANIAIDQHAYYTGSLYDLPLVISMIGLVQMARLASRLPLGSEQQQQSNREASIFAARLAMGAILSMPLLAAWAIHGDLPANIRAFRVDLTLLVMLVSGCLVFIKQQGLDRELLRLLQASEHDYQNLRQLQSQLVQSEKLASMGQLVGGAAHELNNPLTALLGYADLLKSGEGLTGEQKSLAAKIVQQAERTRELVSSLLSFASQAPGQKNRLDLNSLARTAVHQMQPRLRMAGIELYLNLAEDVAFVQGDKNQLLQVCLHILRNAQHALHGREGGMITVSSFEENGFVCLEFADNGPGAHEPGKVFDPFYTTKPVGQGTGLGLSACYGIVQEHRGKILCQNRPQGGALFRVEIPVSEARSKGAATAASGQA